jgi:hypothetical protein
MSGPFVRKNVLVAQAVFTPEDGVSAPSSAFCVVNYCDLTGVDQQVSIPMTSNLGGDLITTWTATWDSSAAREGTVSWVIYSTGALQAATQGQFQVLANQANNI